MVWDDLQWNISLRLVSKYGYKKQFFMNDWDSGMVWDQRTAMSRESNTKAQITSWSKTGRKSSNLVWNNAEWRDCLGGWKGHKYMNPSQ